MEILHIAISIILAVVIVALTLYNNLKVRKQKTFLVTSLISSNDIIRFRRIFDREMRQRNKSFKRETNLRHRRRMQRSGNVSGRKDFNLMNHYFHFLVGYLFDGKGDLFTKWDHDLMGEERPERLRTPSTGFTSSNVIDQLVKPGAVVNPYSRYSPAEKREVAELIAKSREFFEGSEYSFYDKFLYCMLSQQMDIDCVDNSGRTPLFIACYLGKEDLVHKLLAKKANLYKKNPDIMFLCPLTALVIKRRFRILAGLIEKKQVDMKFLANEIEILYRQGTLLQQEYEDVAKLLKPFWLKKQIVNFVSKREETKYLRHFTDEQMCYFLKKYVLSDVFGERV